VSPDNDIGIDDESLMEVTSRSFLSNRDLVVEHVLLSRCRSRPHKDCKETNCPQQSELEYFHDLMDSNVCLPMKLKVTGLPGKE